MQTNSNSFATTMDVIDLAPAPSASPVVDTLPRLSRRQRDVLYWLAQGKSGRETAVILGITLCTVRVHIRDMIRKLGAANIPHAVARAFQRGILDP
jgi:DNA-binding CsgD family transcriptional regulator